MNQRSPAVEIPRFARDDSYGVAQTALTRAIEERARGSGVVIRIVGEIARVAQGVHVTPGAIERGGDFEQPYAVRGNNPPGCAHGNPAVARVVKQRR